MYRLAPTEGQDANELLVIDVSDDGGVRVLRLDGELDMAGVPHFESSLLGNRPPGTATFVLDLRELTFIDSSGIRALIMADKSVRDGGGRLIVVRGSQRVDQVLEMTGVARQIEVVDEPPVA